MSTYLLELCRLQLSGCWLVGCWGCRFTEWHQSWSKTLEILWDSAMQASQPTSLPANHLASQPSQQPASQLASQPPSQAGSQPASQAISQPASQSHPMFFHKYVVFCLFEDCFFVHSVIGIIGQAIFDYSYTQMFIFRTPHTAHFLNQK